jgi:hypothetical protein
MADPGWYPAPDRPGSRRYWDGTQWTDAYDPPDLTSLAAAAEPQRGPSRGFSWLMILGALPVILIAIAIIGSSLEGDDDETARLGNSSGGGLVAGSSSDDLEREIQARYDQLLRDINDPHFIGDPVVDVRCAGDACKAELASKLATNIPLGTDRWAGGELKGGSNIAGFLVADADFRCHIASTEAATVSASLRALKPCSSVVATKNIEALTR